MVRKAFSRVMAVLTPPPVRQGLVQVLIKDCDGMILFVSENHFTDDRCYFKRNSHASENKKRAAKAALKYLGRLHKKTDYWVSRGDIDGKYIVVWFPIRDDFTFEKVCFDHDFVYVNPDGETLGGHDVKVLLETVKTAELDVKIYLHDQIHA